MPGAVCFAIFGKDSGRLFFSVNEKFTKSLFEVEMFVHCSLDIVDDKLTKATEPYLGHLYSDQKYKSFGFVSNTGIRMVLVLDLGDMSLKDQDVRAIFKKFQHQYCSAIANPFYKMGSELNSRFLKESATSIFIE